MDSSFRKDDSTTTRKVSRTFAEGEMTKDGFANVVANDKSQQRVDETSKYTHEEK